MNNKQKGVLLIGVAFFTAMAVAVLLTPGEYEFVCYTQDKLTERHVGVRPFWTYRSADTFQVSYVDGPGKSYKQRPGESCGVERVR